jgi:P4 family phage/plasmid primase-like protien
MAGKSPRSRPHVFVRDTLIRHNRQTVFTSGQWFRFDGKLWQQLPEFQIDQEAQAIIDNDKKLAIAATAPTLASIVELIRVKCSKSDGLMDSNADLIALGDCTLEISTRQRKPHDWKHYLTTAFPFDYDPAVRSDVWEYYLDAVIPSDCLSFLQEFAGYALTTDTLKETAVWLYGPSGCGKSTFLDGLRAAFGNRVTTFSIANLEARFGLSHLSGKTLAIAAEQPATVRQAQILNQLISGEGVVVDRKYHDPFEMFCRAKFLWAMNEIPDIPRSGVGLTRRVVVIQFPPIEETKQDENIKRQIKLSGQAIFNWALEGLERLQARGHFVKPAESAHVLKLVAKDHEIRVFD